MSAASPGAPPRRRFWSRRRALCAAAIYLVALLASHASVLLSSPADPDDALVERAPDPYRYVEAAPHDDVQLRSGQRRTAYLEWSAAGAHAIPIVLLHGSPGSARNFDELGLSLAAQGRRVLALDLPGFGHSSPRDDDYSILAHARAVLATLDELTVERAHVVGWSMGGGVALHMADLAPDRVASVTLLASIGVQEGEGSGSYYFEHAKYAALFAGLVVAPELIPHFGVIGGADARHAFVRNFWDTDQRPLRAVLERTRTPLFVIHGRNDFLAPAHVARETHELVRDSRFVLLEGSHFLPFEGAWGNLADLERELPPFFARHDAHGAKEPREFVDATRARTGIERLDFEPFQLLSRVPWWLQIALIALLARWRRFMCAVVAGALLAAFQLDVGIALASVAFGAFLSGEGWRQRFKRAFAATGATLASALVCAVAVLAAGKALPRSVAIAGLVLSVSAALAYVRWKRRKDAQQIARAILRRR